MGMAINKRDFLSKNTDGHLIPNTNERHEMDCSYQRAQKARERCKGCICTASKARSVKYVKRIVLRELSENLRLLSAVRAIGHPV